MPENPYQKQQREKRDKEIVKLYPEKTLKTIGEKYKLSPQRIKQIIDKNNAKRLS